MRKSKADKGCPRSQNCFSVVLAWCPLAIYKYIYIWGDVRYGCFVFFSWNAEKQVECIVYSSRVRNSWWIHTQGSFFALATTPLILDREALLFQLRAL